MPLAKGEAGEHPALCPQLYVQGHDGRTSQIPALTRRPFPGRDQPSDVGKTQARPAPFPP